MADNYRILTPHRTVQPESTTSTETSTPTEDRRNRILRAARKLANAGRAVGPVGSNKAPVWIEGLLENGKNDYTTDLKTLTMMFSRAGRGATGVGMRLERLAVVDIEHPDKRPGGPDGFAECQQLEEEHGELPATRTHGTANGGAHRIYKIPEGVELTGKGLAPGVELLVKGQIVVPPSPGRTVEDPREPVELPEAWVRLAQKQPGASSGGSPGDSRRQQKATPNWNGSPIPIGERWITLRSEACRLHDGTRSEQELYADLLMVPLEQPEGDIFTGAEIAKLARWAHQREPCSPPGNKGERVASVAEKVRAWEAEFLRLFGEGFRGLAGQSDRDVLRRVLDGMAEHGRETEDGGTEFDMCLQDMAEWTGLCRQTVSTAAKRLHESTGLVHDTYRCRGTKLAGTWRLPRPPAQGLTTPPISSSLTGERGIGGVVKSCAPPRLVGLETPCFAHFGPVGKGRGGILLALRIYGPLDDDGLEAVTGTRVRDLRRRYLNDTRDRSGKLLKAGLLSEGEVVETGGVHSLPGDHADRGEAALSRAYSTVREQKVRIKEPDTGRVRTETRETGMVASQNQRESVRRERYERQREGWEEALRCKREAEQRRLAEDKEIIRSMNRWDEERSDEAPPEAEPERIIEYEGRLVSMPDGEELGHVPDCACMECEYERLSSNGVEGAA